MCNVRSAMYNVQCTMCNVQSAMYNVQCTKCNVQSTRDYFFLVNKANLVHVFRSMFISWYINESLTFRAAMCPSSGETTVFIWHLVLVILCGWPSGMQGAPCIPDGHPYRITSTIHHINTVVSPDDGNIVARNMSRFINILRKIVYQVGFFFTRTFRDAWSTKHKINFVICKLRIL